MEDNRDVPRDQSDGEAEERLSKQRPAQPDGLTGAGRRASDDDDFDFVVTEAHDQQAPQFLNQAKQQTRDDDLGLESTADLMEDRAQHNPTPSGQIPPRPDYSPIGQSEPSLPPTSDFSSQYGDLGQDDSYEPPAQQPTQPEVQQQPKAADLGPNEIGKLSAEEVASINKNLYGGGGSYLSDDEKQKLISSMDDGKKPFGNAPIEPPKKSKPAGISPEALHNEIHQEEQDALSASSRPTMATRQRGVAYFMKNYIQVQGSQQLMENDELRINDREYTLRKKTFSPKVVASVLGSLFVILLLIIGSQFVSSAAGEGQVIGVVVDDMDKPFLQKAVIRFPDLGKSFQSNEQGFFRTGALPQGNHKIEYTIDGTLIGVDYATVVGGEITTLVLKPNDVSDQQPVAVSQKPAPKQFAQARPSSAEPQPTASSSSDNSNSEKSSKSSSGKSSKESYAKLALAANVEGAKLAIDGNVIGAGNLTYSKLSPGRHSYSVTKDGFDTKTGSITLRANGTSKLEVELTPLTQAAKTQTYDADDFFHSGLNLLRDGKYETAAADFSETIKKKPSHAEAHFGRAQAYEMLNDKQAAFDDYLRAAEIFQFRKDYNQAITSYNKAIELDPQSVAPLLGRANIYLSKGEQIAAIADFDAVIDRDKKNWQAHFGLGKARFEQGYYKKAVNHFKEARSLDSENAEIYQYLMLSYMGANDVKNVKKSYEKFTEVATDQQKQQFQQDNRFTAVRRVIDMES